VALNEIPDNNTRTSLRELLLPVVYFLVFTSIVVHGITIPIGKGFQNVRSLTLTRSQTDTAADRVSRLPAPLPFGSVSLRETVKQEQVAGARNEDVTGDISEARAETAIRFDVETDHEERATVVTKRPGILSRGNSPPRSPTTSPPSSIRQDSHHCLQGPPPVVERTWIEGRNVIVENEDGDRVCVP
jgi:NhaP-type Na+/H+ or K+/H+ antiporter